MSGVKRLRCAPRTFGSVEGRAGRGAVFQEADKTDQLAIDQTESHGGGALMRHGVDFVANHLNYLTSLLTLTTTQQIGLRFFSRNDSAGETRCESA